jgi:hypothetical protein
MEHAFSRIMNTLRNIGVYTYMLFDARLIRDTSLPIKSNTINAQAGGSTTTRSTTVAFPAANAIICSSEHDNASGYQLT